MLDWFQMFFECAEIIGTVAFAASGAMIAIERELDMFGVAFLGIFAAVGGGIMRDLMLGIMPPSAFRDSTYVAVAVVTALVVFLFAWLDQRRYRKRYALMDRIINLLDAIGLGIFGVVGVETALGMGHQDNVCLCIFMGMTTGVGGGILRDLFSQTVPAVLKKRIYAVASIAGCTVYYLLRHTSLASALAMLTGTLITILIRLFSTHYHWNLPTASRQ